MKLLPVLIPFVVLGPLWAQEKKVDENVDYIVSATGNSPAPGRCKQGPSKRRLFRDFGRINSADSPNWVIAG
jgi:hypothetical protein